MKKTVRQKRYSCECTRQKIQISIYTKKNKSYMLLFICVSTWYIDIFVILISVGSLVACHMRAY